jgi:hypothetical protein
MPVTVEELTPEERKIFDTLGAFEQQIFLDLPAPVRGIVGRWAPANAGDAAQQQAGACIPDPRVTAQVGIRKPSDFSTLSADIKFREHVLPYRLKSARRGHLLLSPGGPSGLIGAMLGALAPAQDYSHMGIVIEDNGFDGTVVRHCTTSEEWLNSKLFTTGTVFDHTPLSIDIPQHGFRSDAVKFLWPGTVTQTVEIAFKASKSSLYRREVFQTTDSGDYVMEDDEIGEPQKVITNRFATVDAPNGPDDNRSTGKRFLIHALSFDAAFVGETKTTPAHMAEALIVHPCITRETQAVRDALARIADATLALRGHYRFFSYSQARVSELEDEPPTLEQASAPACVDGQMVTTPVTATRGMVCSTFIWQAVQLANRQGLPRIVLDGRPARTEPGHDIADLCEQLTALYHGRQRVRGATLDPADPQDGLYFYGEESRHAAAVALQAKLVAKVMDHLSGFIDDVAGPPLIGGLIGGGAGVIISQLIGANPVLLAILLGVSTAYIDTQVEILRETAKHLSNQMGATFQSDNSAQDNESDDWQRNPGTGNTVSPDDTLNHWAAPYHESATEVVGLYGSSQRAEVLSPSLEEGPVTLSTWEICTDTSSLLARVFFLDANGAQSFVANARVRVGAFEMTTTSQPNMADPQVCGPLRTGQYYARAGWQDPATGFQWMGPRRVVTVPGPQLDLQVFPPKETRRSVRISGKADLLNRHASDDIPVIGTDPWERNDVGFDSGWFPMSLDFAHLDGGEDPDFAAWLRLNYPGELTGTALTTYVWEADMEDWGIAQVKLDCTLASNGDVIIVPTGGTKAGDEDETTFADPQPRITVQRKGNNNDGGLTFDMTVERTGPAFAPVRATIHFVVDNNQQGG